jgi:hypothetical protein
MLEKEPGNPKIHRLHIIALIESDYNQSQPILLARRLTHKMEDINLIPDMQYGSRPGQLCISPVLNKQLTHDIIRQTKQMAALIENDTVGCYDRLMNPLVLLAMRWLGVSETLARSIALTWSNTTHSIKTQYGLSSVSYTNTPATSLFGSGQGSTTGPTLWQMSFVILEDSVIEAGIDLSELEEPIHQLTLTSVDEEIDIDSPGEAFVDGSNFGSSSSVPSHPHIVSVVDKCSLFFSCFSNLQVIAQRWERALFSTGGAINFSKGFWFVFHLKWKSGVAYLTAPPPSVQLALTEGNNFENPVQVPHKSFYDTYRTLGVHISPSGDTKASFQVLLAKATDYQTKIAASKLPKEAALLSYNVYLLPKLGYPLPALTFTEEQCHALQSPTLMAFLPKIQLNHHIARSIVYGSLTYGGLGIKNLYSIQSLGQLTLFVGHNRVQDKTSKLLRISLSYLQLAVGSTTSVLSLPSKTYVSWIDSCWLVSFWVFLSRLQIQVHLTQHWLPVISWQNDMVLMDHFITQGYSAAALGTLNRCRLYLQVITLSDIVSADGSCIISDILHGIPLTERTSTLKWPSQQRPPAKAWDLWSSALKSLQPRNTLLCPLGNWTSISSHQTWNWCIDRSSFSLYNCDPITDSWRVHRRIGDSRRCTRSTASFVFEPIASFSVSHPPANLLPASLTFSKYTGLTSAIPGPSRPSPPLPLPLVATVQGLLTQ